MNKQLQIVTFEQAKKLKELGFNWDSVYYYHYDKCLYPPQNSFGRNWNDDSKFLTERISAPTTALALKWLRDEKNIIVNVILTYKIINEKYLVQVFNKIGLIEEDFIKNDASIYKAMKGTYGEAESTGLDYALEYLLKLK